MLQNKIYKHHYKLVEIRESNLEDENIKKNFDYKIIMQNHVGL